MDLVRRAERKAIGRQNAAAETAEFPGCSLHDRLPHETGVTSAFSVGCYYRELWTSSQPESREANAVVPWRITLSTRNVPTSVAFSRTLAGSGARPGNIGTTAAWLRSPRDRAAPDRGSAFEPSPFEKSLAGISPSLSRWQFPVERALQAMGRIDRALRETPLTFFFRDPNGYVFEVVEENHDEPGPSTDACSHSVAADPQRIGNPVDVVEPRRDQRDLQDRPVVKAGTAQPFVVQGRDLGRVLGELDHVIDHHPFC